MVIASIIFAVAFVLVLLGDRLLPADQKAGKPRPASLDRAKNLMTPLLWAAMAGSCLAMSIIQMLTGVSKGVRTGIIVRAEHPFWFWSFTGILFLASLGMVIWNLRDFFRALKVSAVKVSAVKQAKP